MPLLVIAYPELNVIDYNRIQGFRALHDLLYYGIVEPHFTFVFPGRDMDVNQFIAEIESKAANTKSIHFILRTATINKDAFSDYYHIFLVPDEGNGRMIRLHDKLYSGSLHSQFLLDIDFIPHITVGNSTEANHCKALADEWNQEEFSFPGVIKQLSVVRFEHNVVTPLKNIPLVRE